MKCQRALSAIADAVERIDAHLAGSRDGSLGNDYDGQLRHFRLLLLRWKRAIEDGAPPSVDGSMTWAVADSWPFESPLANAIISAEAECQKLLDRGTLRKAGLANADSNEKPICARSDDSAGSSQNRGPTDPDRDEGPDKDD